MSKDDVIARLLDPGIIAIIRADHSEHLQRACEALVEGGIHAVEVTMTTPDALSVIAQTAEELGPQICLGVGTVLDEVTARNAMLAGAQYVVTPVMRAEIIRCCRRYGVPIACGAFTPTEALAAHEAGADFVKIFPADSVGPAYIKAIKAPLPQLRIIPTGGVTVETVGAFLKAGSSAVAAGSCLVSRDILAKGDWPQLTQRAREFVAAMEVARA
ncbi:MAG: bifunctional 4-hydroxy-2-oxoglutarate aldolase/2-dehydro-3-deoxy-phosphogluconate aldolase [Verrucomicrobiota bacterium]